MKIVSKSELGYSKGYIVNGDGEIMMVPIAVVEQLNKLDRMAQDAKHMAAQPKLQIPDVKEVEYETEHDKPTVKFTCDTPEIDKHAKEMAAMFEEASNQSSVDKAERLANRFMEAMEWAYNDEFVTDKASYTVDRFDLPVLGNPLLLTVDKIVNTVFDYVMAMDGKNNLIGIERVGN